MKKATIIIILACVAAIAQDINWLKSLDLETYKQEFGLNAENSKEVQNMQLDPSKESSEGAGRKQVEAEAQDPDSAVGVIVRLPEPTQAEQEAFDAEHASFDAEKATADIDTSWVQEPTGDKTPNLAESIVPVWVAGEIAKDAHSQLAYMDGYDIDSTQKCYGKVEQRVQVQGGNGYSYKDVMVDVEVPCLPDPDTERVCYTTGTYVQAGYWQQGTGGGGNDSGGTGGRSFRDSSGDSGDRYDNNSTWIPERTISVPNVPVACPLEANEFLGRASIFGGQEESCYDPKVGFNTCSIEAKVSAKYECEANEKQFADYDSCSAACGDSICEKVQQYDDPKLEKLGFDFTELSGAGETEKRLAVGKALNACRQYRTKDKTVGPFDTKIGEYKYSCCYSSAISMELSAVIKNQLGLPNNCEGVPLADLEKIDFNDPAIIKIMEKQTGRLMDQNMLDDINSKYGDMPHDDGAANKAAQDAEKRVNDYKNRIPNI